jgi:glycosyltransferase involved in cell wall biosynthesis
MKVLIISLYPLDSIGGGEVYTINSALSVARKDEVDLYAPTSNIPDGERRYSALSEVQFSSVLLNGRYNHSKRLLFKALLLALHQYDVIWIHQYLSNLLFYMILGSTSQDQLVLMTSLGHEPCLDDFLRTYNRSSNHHFCEISRYSAKRTIDRLEPDGERAQVYGACWANMLAAPRAQRSAILKISAVGRVLPHKGFETTIQALQHGEELNLAGPLDNADPYVAYLRQLPCSGKVNFVGPLTEKRKAALVSSSDVLVASSTTKLYNGRSIEQSELLGLVIIEAICSGVWPIVSNQPAFVEVMEALECSDFVFEQGNASSLRDALDRFQALPLDIIKNRLISMQSRVRKHWCYDEYWIRLIETIHRR